MQKRKLSITVLLLFLVSIILNTCIKSEFNPYHYVPMWILITVLIISLNGNNSSGKKHASLLTILLICLTISIIDVTNYILSHNIHYIYSGICSIIGVIIASFVIYRKRNKTGFYNFKRR